jgi:hypothetical protein
LAASFIDGSTGLLAGLLSIWALLAAASLIFVIKAACAAVLLGVTVMMILMSLALGRELRVQSLFQLAFEAIAGQGAEAFVVLCLVLTLIYALFSVIATAFLHGFRAAADSAISLVDR